MGSYLRLRSKAGFWVYEAWDVLLLLDSESRLDSLSEMMSDLCYVTRRDEDEGMRCGRCWFQ